MRLLPIPLRLPALLLGACVALAGCSEASPPPPERQSEEAKKARENSDLTEAMQAPIDKAKSVEDIQAQHDAEQARAIEEAQEDYDSEQPEESDE
jgi:hypothetical protein